MKRIITICAAILMTASVFAQAPEKMSYQAVVRDGSDALVTSTAVGMQISILQGTSAGTAVYVETQTSTSNANGLVSLEIGSGTVVSGDFTTIDWANGPYFIKTETDPTGGTSYTITGTSQLLSVPYALYAENAGNSTPGPQGPAGLDGNGIASTVDDGDGTFTLTYDDGSTFTTSDLTGPTGAQGPQGNQGPVGATGAQGADGNGIASTVDNGDGTFTFTYDDGSTFTTSDLTGPTGAQGPQGNQGPVGATGAQGADGNGIASTVDNGDGTFTLTYDDGSTFTTSDLTGQTGAQGADGNGIASTTDNGDGTFTLTYDDGSTFTTSDLTGPTGGGSTLAIGDSYQGGIIFWLDATGQHGLIAATADQSTGIQWYNGSYTTTNAVRDGIDAGMYNTERIIANQGVGSYAAQLCANYQGGGYGDWYLPSKYELNLLYLQETAVGGFASADYWSSSEYSIFGAWGQFFVNGYQNVDFFKDDAGRVRAVRAF